MFTVTLTYKAGGSRVMKHLDALAVLTHLTHWIRTGILRDGEVIEFSIRRNPV